MQTHNRRWFLKTSSLAAGAVALQPAARVLGANDTLNVAVVGCGGQGQYHIRCLRQLPGVRVVAVCDPDERVLHRLDKEFRDRQETVETYTDVRRLLENPS